MRTFQPPQQREVPPYVWHEAMFSPPECQALIRLGEAKGLTQGAIGNGIDGKFEVNDSYRQVRTSRLMPEDAPWAFDRIVERTDSTNREHFRYDITGMYEGLTFLRYDFEEGKPGKYDWHQDIGGGICSLRKLSMSAQLSDPSEYDGCRLRLFTNMDFDPGRVALGDAVIFPSYLPHCVTPITRGRRYALVAWIGGPQFC